MTTVENKISDLSNLVKKTDYDAKMSDIENKYITTATLGNSLFGAVKLVKNAVGLNMKGTFSFPTGGFGKNVIIFGVDMSFSMHVYNKKNDNLILGEGLHKD